MSHPTNNPAHAYPHSLWAGHRFRLCLTVAVSLVACLLAAPSAMAKFSLKALRLGSSSGAVDYLYSAGNTVVAQGWVDRHRYYRFDVYDPSGTVRWSSACRPATSNGTVTGGYTLQSTDPDSNATGWRFRMREFNNSGSCGSSNSSQSDASLYFDVASAASYSSPALTNPQSAFKAGAAAYVQLAGVGRLSTGSSNTAQGAGSWSTRWILPSGATACANTTGSDEPGSSAGGELPASTSQSGAQPNLQYAPSASSGVDPWNLASNYGSPCPAFGNGNQGQWKLEVSRDSTHFVTLPAFAVETVPPDTTLTSGPSNVTTSTSAIFTFASSEAGTSFQCRLDGAAATSCTSPSTYSGFANGTHHTFSVAAVDAAGNVDPTPATTSWSVDTTTPSVTVSAPAAGGYTKDTTPTISGTAETKSGEGNVTVDVYAGTTATGTPLQTLSAAVQSGGGWSVDASTLPEGLYTLQAQQTNAAQTTGYSEQESFTVDTTAPAVALYAPSNGTHTNNPQPQITGTAGTALSDLPTVTVTVTGTGSPVQATANVAGDGTWNVYLPQALADGTYTVQAAQKDQASNAGYSYSYITIDTGSPQTFLDAAPVNVTSSTTATFSFHSTDALSQAGSTFVCELDTGNWSPCSSPQSYHNLAQGSHTFSVEAVDGAGNVDTSGASTTWTVNSSLPAVTLTSPGAGSSTNDTTPTFSGTAGTAAGNSATVQVLIYRNTDLTGSPVQTLSATRGTDGSWSVTPSSALADGTYVIYAQQAATAGTATSNPLSFTINTQPPTTTITVGPPGASATGTADFSFSASEAGSTFQCQLDGGGWTSCTSPQDYSGLGNGSHTFQVRATDPAGNTGTAASDSWSVNSNLPHLTLSSPSDGLVTNNQAPGISGTGGTASGDASTVTVNVFSGTSISGTPLQTITTPVASGSGIWTTHPSPLADGTYTVYAQQAGTAGTAYTQASTFTVDTTPPTTSIVSEPGGETAATTARFTFTSSPAGSTFECQLDGGAWTACTSPQSYSSLSTGAHSFSVRATDPAGNVDPDPPLANWTVDPTVPVTVTAPADGTVTNNPTPTFSGNASAANGQVSIEIDDANGNAVEVLTAGAGSTWTATASPGLPDGSYTAFASQLGSDNVTTDYSNVVGFTVDTTPPTTTITAGPGASTSATSASFSFTSSEAGSSFKCRLDAGSWTACSSPQAYGSLASGGHTFSVRATDVAGNTDPSPPSQTWTITGAQPTNTVTLTAPTDGSVTSNRSPTFSGAASGTNGPVTVQIDGASNTPVETLTASAGATWSVTASPTLPDGTYTATAAQLAADGVTTNHSNKITFTIATATSPGSNPPSDPGGSSAPNASGGTSSGQPGAGGQTGAPGVRAALVKLILRAKGAQHLGHKGAVRLLVTATCSSTCKLALSGRITSTTRSRRGHRASARTLLVRRLPAAKLLAGKLVKLRITLPAGARKALLKALASRQRLTLTLTATATVPGLAPGSAHVTIRLIV